MKNMTETTTTTRAAERLREIGEQNKETPLTAEDLVTGEMVAEAAATYLPLGHDYRIAMTAALRAVAPLIAARAIRQTPLVSSAFDVVRAVAAEREACARVINKLGDANPSYHSRSALWAGAAKIRARGETP